MSFLTATLEWTIHNPEPIPTHVQNKTGPPPLGSYIWDGSVTDLIELSIALYNIKLVRKSSGKLITFAEIIHGFSLIFNIKIPKNIYSRKSRTIERKKNPSSMLERLLAIYKHEVDKFYK